MIKLKSRSSAENKRTNYGSALVFISIFTLIAQQIYLGLVMLFWGVVLISIQEIVRIDLGKKIAIQHYVIMKMIVPFIKKKIDLKLFDGLHSEQSAIKVSQC